MGEKTVGQGNLESLRREYTRKAITKENVESDPFDQFSEWFEEALESDVTDANAMTLATVDEQGRPDARIVLMKGFDEQGLVFFTNYQSAKARQIAHNAEVAAVFWWSEFERQVRITGVETKVTDTDRLLVAASAVIPVFGFPQWKGYPNLREVLLYSDTFDDDDFSVEGEDRDTLGLVGWDELNGQMILSQLALRLGFEPDAHINVGIHEFVHLLDMVDGATDGVPELLLDPKHIPSWLKLVDREIEAIRRDQSVLPEYGGTDEAEFLAVAAEYFFQRPRYLKYHHPELFAQLQRIFRQDLNGS